MNLETGNNLNLKSNSPALSIRNEYYSLHLKDGIGIAEYTPGIRISYEDAREIVNQRLKVFGDISYPVLIKGNKVLKVDKDAREYLFSQGVANFVAMAFIERNPLEKMLANAMIRLQPVGIPCRIFLSEETALEWLRSHL